MNQNASEGQPSQPGQPDQVPPEVQPPAPDTDNPGQPSHTPSETPPLSPDIDQPSPGTTPDPTPTSPIGTGIVAPPD